MFHSKVLFLAFLLLATNVFAARINYSAKYHDKDKIARTSKNAEVPDDKEQLILDNMATWSDNKYNAANSKHNVIQVTNAEPAASKGKASEEVQEMQSIVSKNIKSTVVEDQVASVNQIVPPSNQTVASTNQTRLVRLARRFDH